MIKDTMYRAPSPRLLVALVALASWPIWSWYARRMQDGSDDPWGLLALVTLGALLAGERHERARDAAPAGVLYAVSAAMLGYAAAVLCGLPPIFRAGFVAVAFAVVGSWVRDKRIFDPALWALALLSLPVIASLQFTIGYPLRALTATLAAPLVRVSGVPAIADGTLLRIGHEVVVVDGPCSGVRMLWTGAYLTATLAALLRLSTRRTLGLGAMAVVVVVVANVSRASAVLFLERFEAARPLDPARAPIPEFLHQGAGAVTFVIVAAGIGAAGSWLARPPALTSSLRDSCSRPRASGGTVAHITTEEWSTWSATEAVCATTPPLARGREQKTRRVVLRAGGLTLLLAATAPLFTAHWTQATRVAAGAQALDFPTHFEGRELHALELGERERDVLGSFPGKVGRFHDGTHTVVLRWVTKPTRALHPAKDCYRGLGFSVHTIEPWRDAEGRVWSRFEAEHPVTGEHLVVRESITGSDGASSADLSSWYWSANFGRTKGPWLAWTVATRADRSAIDASPTGR
ncbi:MAG: archaeosortase/exosortase family protein [Myxococcota bacterium]